MKHLVLAMFAMALSFGAFAQTQPTQDTIPTEQKTQAKAVYVFKDSKMWIVKDGQKTEMNADVTLPNGMMVNTKGEVKSTDGQTIALKDGQYIDEEGNIGDWKDQAFQ